MVKIWKALIIISLLFIVGCGNEEAITGEAVFDSTDLVSSCPDCICEECLDCPEPDPCPECKKCERCEKCKECPTCKTCPEQKENLNEMEISISNLKLFTTTKITSDQQIFDFNLTKNQTNLWSEGELSFSPECKDNSRQISVGFNDKSLYKGKPDCKNTMTFDIKNIDTVNELRFGSNVTRDYKVKSIQIEVKYKNNTWETINFPAFLFEVIEGPEKTEFFNLSSVNLTNTYSYVFKLTKKQTESDMLFEFTGTASEDILYVYLNGNKLSSKSVDKVKKVITLPSKYLYEKKNTLKLVGIAKS